MTATAPPEWLEYLKAEGLPYIEKIAHIARDRIELAKMTREWIARFPAEAAAATAAEEVPPAIEDQGVGKFGRYLPTEDQAPGIPDGEDLAEVSTAAAAPADPEELEHDQAEPPPPAPKARPIPEPTGEGLPVPLWGDLTMRVYPDPGGACPIEFVKADRGRIYIDSPKSPPWLSTRIQDRLVAGLTAALGDEARPREFMRRKVGEAFAEIADRLENDPDARKALTPPAVRKVIELTERVIVYPSQATTYEILIGGRDLSITAQQMARTDPAFINAAWLNLFPTDPLNATRREWLMIQAAWTDPAAVEVREVEEATEAETVIDRLAEYLAPVQLVTSAEHMTGPEFAWHDESKGVVWVHGRKIARFLDEELKRPGWNDGKLSATLQQAGYTFGKTGKPRIGLDAGKGKAGKQVRCWPFKPGLIGFLPVTPEPLEVSDVIRP